MPCNDCRGFLNNDFILRRLKTRLEAQKQLVDTRDALKYFRNL